MNARLPALLLCGTLSAAVAGVVSLLMAEPATEVPQFGPEIRPLEDAAQPLHDVLSRLDALSREFEEFRGPQLGAVSRVPVDGYATKAEVDTLRERVEAVAEAVRELQGSDRKASIVTSVSKRVLATAVLRPTDREQNLENRAAYIGDVDEMQMAQLRELETTWDMRDRDLLLICEGVSANAAVQAIASHEVEYRAAVEAILTPDQREKWLKNGITFVRRYRD